ncbi:MAG: hypothetical protein ACO1N2_02960 [Candidatus Saccharimonadota bacterium]
MIPILVFAALALLLFAGAFISKRRFGLLGLALTAGATLSTIWSYDAGLVVSSTGLVPEGVITQAVTQSLVVLLPAILLLFHGYTYKNLVGRIIGSALFAILALAFLVEPIGYALPLEGIGADVYGFLKNYKEVIISVGVILAVADLFFTKPAAVAERSRRR